MFKADSISVEGGPQLRRALKGMEHGLDDLKDANKSGAEIVADEGRDLVPVVSGLLESTIRATADKSKGEVRAGGGRAVYGPPIHFGWAARNIEPQPFLYQALENKREEVFLRYNKRVDELVKRLDREAP